MYYEQNNYPSNYWTWRKVHARVKAAFYNKIMQNRQPQLQTRNKKNQELPIDCKNWPLVVLSKESKDHLLKLLRELLPIL